MQRLRVNTDRMLRRKILVVKISLSDFHTYSVTFHNGRQVVHMRKVMMLCFEYVLCHTFVPNRLVLKYFINTELHGETFCY
jgi:hypothetical protein